MGEKEGRKSGERGVGRPVLAMVFTGVVYAKNPASAPPMHWGNCIPEQKSVFQKIKAFYGKRFLFLECEYPQCFRYNSVYIAAGSKIQQANENKADGMIGNPGSFH